MPARIHLHRQQIADLKAISELGPDSLRRVVKRLQALSSPLLRPAALRKEISEALDGDERAAEALLSPVLALCQLVRQRDISIEELLDGLRRGLEVTEPPWSESEQTAWASIEPVLGDLFMMPAVRTVSKSIDLAYEYANLFQGARIVTDVRPVFNDKDNASEMHIDGAVISFTLRLHHDNREGNHSLSVALDEADVKSLLQQCKRALQKAKHLQTFNLEAGIPSIICGATDESDKE